MRRMLLLGALGVLVIAGLVALVAYVSADDGSDAPPERAAGRPEDAQEGALAAPPSAQAPTGADTAVTPRLQATEAQPLPAVLVDPRVLIEKARRTLTVYSDGEPVKRYRIALGREPIGDKEREGDGRTPNGEFYVCTRNAQSKYHRALGLSYPNEEDAERGLADGLITKREYRTIVDALRRMQQPPWKTALGGEIMIHGAGSERGDWTLGCIALDDDDAEELFDAVPLGTPVEIVE